MFLSLLFVWRFMSVPCSCVGDETMKTLYPILLLTNLASTTADRQDLLLTLASTADELSGGINID